MKRIYKEKYRLRYAYKYKTNNKKYVKGLLV